MKTKVVHINAMLPNHCLWRESDKKIGFVC